MSQANTDQPLTMPPDVIALGKPARIHVTSDKRVAMAGAVGGSLCALVGLGFLGIAGMFFYFLAKPFGANPPPPEVALGAGIGCSMVGLCFLGAAVWFLRPNWAGPSGGSRAYLVFDKVLVELFVDRHRIIPWDEIGPLRGTPQPLMPSYRFPVQHGEDLCFDYTVTEHDRLVEEIKRRSGERLVLANLGSAAAQNDLTAATPGPAFVARISAVLYGGKVYRICALGRALVFIKVADAYPVVTAQAAGGLAGGIAAYAQMKRLADFKQRLERLDREATSGRAVLQHVGEFDGSFVADASEFRDLSIDPKSGWTQVFSGVKCTAILNLVHATHGAMALELISPQDMLNAKDELRKLFGDAVKVNVSWRDV